MALPRLSSGFLKACRFGILLFLSAALLQSLSVSAAELHHNSATLSGTPYVYYLRGKLGGRFVREEMSSSSSFEAESVEVADYSPPCANNKHDPSLCKHP